MTKFAMDLFKIGFGMMMLGFCMLSALLVALTGILDTTIRRLRRFCKGAGE